jgi:hypothetical protein
MSNFLKRLFKYIGLLAVLTSLYVLLIFMRPDLVDDFYYRFTTPKAHSLILGGSLAGQGIHPDILNKRICTEENQIINHAFAVGPSSYGPNYLREIAQKLDKNSTNGVFIVEVSPWTLVTDNDDDDSTQFFEVQKKLFVGNLRSSSVNPNFDYLINYWVNKFEPFTRMFKYLVNYEGIAVLHENGWLEITTSMDSTSNNARIRRSLNETKRKNLVLSNTRLNYLDKIIRYADKYGEVFIIRMPVTSQMAEIEHQKYPQFDSVIEEIAHKNNIRYFNFSGLSGQFLTVDAYHLYKKDGEKFTGILCDSIADYLNLEPERDKIAGGKSISEDLN